MVEGSDGMKWVRCSMLISHHSSFGGVGKSCLSFFLLLREEEMLEEIRGKCSKMSWKHFPVLEINFAVMVWGSWGCNPLKWG